MWGRPGGAATSPRLGASLAAPLSCATRGPRGHGPGAGPGALASSARQRRALRSPRVGLWGPGDPAVPGRRHPVWGGEARPASAGSARVVPFAFPARPQGCEVRDPQESELRNPSKVLLPEGCSRVWASAGGDRVAPHLDPHLHFPITSPSRPWGRYEGHVGAPFTPHPAMRLILLTARPPALQTLSVSVQGEGGWGSAYFESVWRN